MALKSYMLTQDFGSPLVRVTGIPHRPQEVRLHKFKRGEIIKGELKHADNKPAFVLVAGKLVVPLDVLKEVVTKDIGVSNADGETAKEEKKEKKLEHTNPRVKYMDAAIIGGLVGFGAVYLAEKQGWIQMPQNKYRVYGVLIGSLAMMYGVYRFKPTPKKIEKKED